MSLSVASKYTCVEEDWFDVNCHLEYAKGVCKPLFILLTYVHKYTAHINKLYYNFVHRVIKHFKYPNKT